MTRLALVVVTMAFFGCSKGPAADPAADQRRAVEAARDSRAIFSDCVRQARERNPTIKGRIVVELAFDPKGAVALSKVPVNETSDMKYALCMSAVAYQVKLPPPVPAAPVSVGVTLDQAGELAFAAP